MIMQNPKKMKGVVCMNKYQRSLQLVCGEGSGAPATDQGSALLTRVRLNIGTTSYARKPADSEIGRIVNDFASETTRREVTLQELLTMVAEEGRPFTPALMATPKSDGTISKCNDCFTSQQVFVLDFDNQGEVISSLDETLQYAAGLDLVPFGAYYTPSSTEIRPKYRILFCLDRPVSNDREREIITRIFLDLFPSADQICKDAARHFNGVTSGRVSHECIDANGLNSIEALAFTWQANGKQDPSNFSAKIKRFAKQYELQLFNGHLRLAGKTPPLVEVRCNENVDSSTISIDVSTETLPASNPAPPLTDTSDYKGGFRGDFFWFTVPLDAARNGERAAIDPKGSTACKQDIKSKASTRDRTERWDRVGAQLRQCELIKLLIDNTVWDKPLSHDEFFHLATTFANIRGGDEVFETALEATRYNAEKRIRQYREIVATKQYHPQACANSTCRFKATCMFFKMPNHRNILSIKFVKGQVRQIESTSNIELNEARILMPTYYEQALQSSKKVNVIRAGCGVGKTTAMLPILVREVQAGKKVVYAAPTHKLLNETCARVLARADGSIKIYRQPDLVKYIEKSDTSLAAEIKLWWATGHHGTAANQIRQWARKQSSENKYDSMNRNDLDEKGRDIIDFLEASDHQHDRSPALWLMTHARLVYGSVEADLCFVDEDILMKNLLVVRQCGFSSLNQLISGLQAMKFNPKTQPKEREQAELGASAINKLMQEIWAAGKGQVTPMPALDFSSAKNLKKALPCPVRFCSDREETEGAESDVLEFLTSNTRAFIWHGRDTIDYISRRDLPVKVGKYIIASASANKWLYEAFFEENGFELFSMPLIAHQGEVYLHPEKSFANNAFELKRKEKTLALIETILEARPHSGVICSKTVKDALPDAHQNRVVATFGSTEGLNQFEGKDLLVIGALHRPDYVYKLIAVALGHRLGLNTTQALQHRCVRRNGFEFYAVTFDDEFLQEVQFALIETELEQAVGRARIGEHNCRVDMYTNIPLPQCKLAS